MTLTAPPRGLRSDAKQSSTSCVSTCAHAWRLSAPRRALPLRHALVLSHGALLIPGCSTAVITPRCSIDVALSSLYCSNHTLLLYRCIHISTALLLRRGLPPAIPRQARGAPILVCVLAQCCGRICNCFCGTCDGLKIPWHADLKEKKTRREHATIALAPRYIDSYYGIRV